jgi:hypothetical protein
VVNFVGNSALKEGECDSDQSPYLEDIANRGGALGYSDNDLVFDPENDVWGEPFDENRSRELEFEAELAKTDYCGKRVLVYEVIGSVNEQYKVKDGLASRMMCGRSWCKICGKKGSITHKRSVSRIINKIEKVININDLTVSQLFLTVPKELRHRFESREMLASLRNIGNRLREKFFPDKVGYSQLHLFGDKEPGVFKPHLNIEMLNKKGEKLAIAPSVIDAIRESFRVRLRALLHCPVEKVVVYYNFKLFKSGVLNSINYMSRPCPNYDDMRILKEKNIDLFKMIVLDLKRFHMRSYFGDWKKFNQGYVPQKTDEDMSGIKLRYDGIKEYKQFREDTRGGDIREVRPGLFHYRSYENIKINGHINRVTMAMRC